MNATASRPVPFAPLRARARQWWGGLAPRERSLVGIAGGLVALFLVWTLLVGPAWRVTRDAPAEMDRLEAQLQQMQRIAADAKALGGTAPVSATQAVEPLKAATARLGEKASLAFQGDRATLTLNGVPAQALRDWLAEARSAAHARPVDVQLNRGSGGYSGLVVVTLGAGAS